MGEILYSLKVYLLVYDCNRYAIWNWNLFCFFWFMILSWSNTKSIYSFVRKGVKRCEKQNVIQFYSCSFVHHLSFRRKPWDTWESSIDQPPSTAVEKVISFLNSNIPSNFAYPCSNHIRISYKQYIINASDAPSIFTRQRHL